MKDRKQPITYHNHAQFVAALEHEEQTGDDHVASVLLKEAIQQLREQRYARAVAPLRMAGYDYEAEEVQAHQ